MREIKFRAWNGNHILDWEWILAMGYPLRTLEAPKDFGWKIMQFTGLLDKRGKEIYEGDIVRVWNPVYKDYGNVTIEYKAPSYRLRFIPCENCPLIEIDRIPTFYDGEIIGNIYENGELLEVEK